MSDLKRNIIRAAFIILLLGSWYGRFMLLLLLIYCLKPSWFSWLEDTPTNDTITRYFILVIIQLLLIWGHYSMKFSGS